MTRAAAEFVVVEFPGEQVGAEAAEALRRATGEGIINVIDMVFITKGTDGGVRVSEIPELGDELSSVYAPVVQAQDGLIGSGDIDEIAETVTPGHTACVVLFENSWAVALRESVSDTGGRVVRQVHIPSEVVTEAASLAAAN